MIFGVYGLALWFAVADRIVPALFFCWAGVHAYYALSSCDITRYRWLEDSFPLLALGYSGVGRRQAERERGRRDILIPPLVTSVYSREVEYTRACIRKLRTRNAFLLLLLRIRRYVWASMYANSGDTIRGPWDRANL